MSAFPLKALIGKLFRISPLTLALVLGSVLASALPPFGFFPVLFLCFPLLLRMTWDSPSFFQAFLRGTCFGAGYFLISFYWINFAYLSLLKSLIWFLPVSVIIFPVMFGALWGMAFCCAHSMRRSPTLYALTVAILLSLVEYLRGQQIINIPWNYIGYGLYRISPLMQTASLWGIHGITLITLLLSTTPFLWMNRRSYGARLTCIAVLLVGGTLLLWGSARLQNEPADSSYSSLIVQPNLSPQDDALPAIKTLILTAPSGTPALVVLPESVFVKHRDEPPVIYEEIAETLPSGSVAAIGVKRHTPSKGRMDVSNSIVFIGTDGNVLATYDKSRLAPWGEVIPYEDVLRKTFMQDFLHDKASLIAGSGAVTLSLPGFPSLSPQICYESAYAGYTPAGTERPQVIILAADDIWTSGTTQPYQSLVYAQIRAIETGVPILRAANFGISAIIDAKGRIRKSVPSGEVGTISGKIPAAVPETPYARHGDLAFLFMAGLLCSVCVIAAIRKY